MADGAGSSDEAVRYEVAEDLLGALRAVSGRRLAQARQRQPVDEDEVAGLVAEHDRYQELRRGLFRATPQQVEEIIATYGPVLRQVSS